MLQHIVLMLIQAYDRDVEMDIWLILQYDISWDMARPYDIAWKKTRHVLGIYAYIPVFNWHISTIYWYILVHTRAYASIYQVYCSIYEFTSI
jgi:hypothetical protein